MNSTITRREIILGSMATFLLGGRISHAAQENTQIRFADNPSISWPQPYIASRDGIWKANGVDVSSTPQRFGTGQSSMNAMLQSDEVQMAVVAETPVTLALMAQMPLTILTGLSYTTWHISANRQANISSLEDLAGCRIGVAVGTSAEYFMDVVLNSVGLTARDVTVINVKPTDMVPALSGGSLDAFFIWDPFRFEARKVLGDDYIELAYPEFKSHAFLVASNEFVAAQPDSVTAILKSLIQANTHTNDKPEENAMYMAELMQIDPTIAQAVWKNHTYEVGFRSQMLDSLRKYSEYVVNKDIMPKGTPVPDFESFMLIDELRAIDPSRVDF